MSRRCAAACAAFAAFLFAFGGAGCGGKGEDTSAPAAPGDKPAPARRSPTPEPKAQPPASKLKRVEVHIEVDRTKPDGKKWDLVKPAPDVVGKLTFGDGNTMIIHKHQDRYRVSGSATNIRLAVGDRIEVYLQDVDVAEDDLIASGFVEYAGGDEFTARVDSASLRFTVTDARP